MVAGGNIRTWRGIGCRPSVKIHSFIRDSVHNGSCERTLMSPTLWFHESWRGGTNTRKSNYIPTHTHTQGNSTGMTSQQGIWRPDLYLEPKWLRCWQCSWPILADHQDNPAYAVKNHGVAAVSRRESVASTKQLFLNRTEICKVLAHLSIRARHPDTRAALVVLGPEFRNSEVDQHLAVKLPLFP